METSNTIDREMTEQTEKPSRVPESLFQPVPLFILLCLLSFGVYLFFWFYKHWRYLKDEKNMDISPGFRTLLILFTGYSLFSTFKKLAIAEGYKGKAPYGLLFLAFCFFIIVSEARELPAVLMLLGPVSFFLLVPALQMMNFYYLHAHPNYRIKKTVGIDEIVFVIVVWVVLFFSFFNS